MDESSKAAMTAACDLPQSPRMSDPLSKAAYDAALSEHRDRIAPTLRRLEAAIESATHGNADPAEVARLHTMRVILLSGLFDAEFYLEKFPDIRYAKVDPLEHYVWHGDEEGRTPNPAFLPSYYRREFMAGVPDAQNALEHYVAVGERSRGKPSSVFDPRAYLTANPGLAEFVDRPLFHYLRIGQFAAERIREAPAALIFPALEYIEELLHDCVEQHLHLMRAKRAFVDKVGVPEGFSVYKEVIRRPDHAEIHWKQLESLRDYSAKHGATFREIAAAGERFVVPSPKVIGEGDCRPLVGYTRSLFVTCLIDARVRAGSNLIEVNDVALLDYQGDELTRFDDQLDYDPAVFQATDGGVWIMTPEGDAATIYVEEAFPLLGVRPDAFGHWMIEFLPRYIAALLSGALPRIPVLIQAGMPETHRQGLELMLPEGVDIIELPQFATAHVRRLWCAPSHVYCRVWEVYNERFEWEYFINPPEQMAPVVREMVRRTDPATADPIGVDRVYLGRTSPDHKLVNSAAIVAAAEARGFVVVYPEQLDFAEQVRLLRHARLVVGQEGSAMYLTLFARPGTRLFMLTNVENVPAPQAEMNGLFGAIGLDVTIITGPCAPRQDHHPGNSHFHIDEDLFCRSLDRWLNGQEPPGPEPQVGPEPEVAK